MWKILGGVSIICNSKAARRPVGSIVVIGLTELVVGITGSAIGVTGLVAAVFGLTGSIGLVTGAVGAIAVIGRKSWC